MVNVFKKAGASSEIKQCGFNLTMNDISQWLINKQILNDKHELLFFEDLDEWSQSGGETYLTRFKISYTNKNQVITKIIVLKAIVSLNSDLQLETWRRRRDILLKYNAPVSFWYSFSNGTILEDYYPYDYKATKNFNDLIFIARILDRLGFVALSFLDDIRCNINGKPFYTDFGFDLGEPTYLKNDVSVTKLLEHYPLRKEEILIKIKNQRE